VKYIQSTAFSSSTSAAMGTEAEVVLQCITEDFVERAKVEYKHRLFRKVSEPMFL
jgi:hypothetical protein